MSMQKLDRARTEFVSATGLISFPKVFPGQAELPKDGALGATKSYKCEHVAATISKQMEDAIAYVAQAHDPNNWQRHVYGALGRLKKLEEMIGRDPAKYPYAVGKYVYNFSKPVSLKMLGMEGANLSDPTVRSEYDRKVNEAAPKVSKWSNPADPFDVQRVQAENAERQLKGLAPLAVDKPVLIPCQSHELYPGSNTQIAGRAYWNMHKKTVSLFLEQILVLPGGERLAGGESSPDAVFGAFAPPADLAPRQETDWSAVV